MTRSRFLPATAVLAMLLALAVLWFWPATGANDRRTIAVGSYEVAAKIQTAANGRPAGLFVELLDEIARRGGWRVNRVPCARTGCLIGGDVQ